ncbi:MAG: dienelactone hydrolase family protein [Chitinophagaceae bacterium]|nr:dienelactone hydrolase family protein [Chitinophagaceae bacterium]
MKKIFLSSILLALVVSGFAQQKTASCCAIDATGEFSRNASSSNFKMSHDEPLPFVYYSEKGEDISFKAPDGTDAYGWEVKAEKKTKYYLFVIHEWWGLNDYIKQESEKLANDLGLNVIALDLYDKKVAATREDAAKYMQTVTTERAQAIIKGAIAYAGKDSKIFTIGWCFGGGWSLQTTLLCGKQAAGAIMFYGQPEKDVEKLKTLSADVIGFFANRDQWPSPQVVDEFKANMEKAGKNLNLNRYDADHAFANPSNPRFNKEATEDSYKKLTAFVKERMK